MNLVTSSSRLRRVQEGGRGRQRNRTTPLHTNLRKEDLGMYSPVMTYSTGQGLVHLVNSSTTADRSTRDQPHTSTYGPDQTVPSDPSTSTSPRGGGRDSVANSRSNHQGRTGRDKQDRNGTTDTHNVLHATPDNPANLARATDTRKDNLPPGGAPAGPHDSRGNSTTKKHAFHDSSRSATCRPRWQPS